ncbi:MAG: hypothetical protein V2I67_15330 [Thermoanaerobaculales bacterium]|nr:hypothetical protein [Thermoanaerobaculales bacterium]
MLLNFVLLLSFCQPLWATDIGPDGFGYIGTDSVDFDWYDMSDGTQLFLNDDELFISPIPLGFLFDYYGTTFDSVRVVSNGFLLFEWIDYNLFQGVQCPLPSPGPVDGLLAFFHRDFNPSDPSCTGECGIFAASGGTVGHRWFGITFEQVPQWYSTPDVPDPVTVQIVLLEFDNRILIQIEDAGTFQGGDAMVGIEAPDGLMGLSWPGCLVDGSVGDNTAILFGRFEAIYADGFESGDTTRWSSSSQGGGADRR